MGGLSPVLAWGGVRGSGRLGPVQSWPGLCCPVLHVWFGFGSADAFEPVMLGVFPRAPS